MACYAYYNNEIRPVETIRIPLTDRALFFGDGVYEVMLARNGRLYQSEEHFERLATSCAATRIFFSFSVREMLSIIHRLIDLSQAEIATVYIQVTRRCTRRQHEIEQLPPNLLITLSPCRDIVKRTVTAITVKDIRSEMCNVKALNLLPSVLALDEARVKCADCAIFVRDGFVTEESRSNVSIIKDGKLITHPRNHYILPGITRKNLITACHECNIAVDERPFTLEEMISAEEIFVSSTTKFIQRVSEINKIAINSGKTSSYELLFDTMYNDFLNKTD